MLDKIFAKIEKFLPPKWRFIVSHEGFRRYFANTGWMFFGQFFSLLVSFFIGILLARRLGPENYGILNYVISFTAIFGIFFCFGTDSVVSREFVKWPDREKELMGTFWGIKLVGGFLTMLSAVLVAVLFNFDRLTIILISIFSAAYLAQSFNVVGLFFQARVESKKSSLAQIAGNVLSAVLKIVWLIFSHDLILLTLIYVSDFIFNSIFLLVYYRAEKKFIGQWRFSWSEAKRIIKAIWPLMFSGLAILAVLRIDQVIIGLMLDKAAVGLYAIADKLTEIWDFIPRLICLSLFPAIINARQVGGDLYRERLKRLYWMMAILSLLALLISLVISRPAINWLLGPNYEPSIALFRIYSLSLPGIFLFTAFNQYLLAEHKEKYIFIVNLIGLALNVSLNLLFIPRFGLPGAAWATVITFIVLPVMMGAAKYRKVKI